MLRRTALVISFLLCATLSVVAQEGDIYVLNGDTLRYTYTPIVPEHHQADTVKKVSFLHKIINYFGESTVDRTFEKKIDFTFAGGPSYSKNTSFGIGVLAAGLYRLDRTDSITQPSNVSIFGNVTVSGVYTIGVRGNNIFSLNKSRIAYTLLFRSEPSKFWGIGYEAGANNEESTYTEKRYQVDGTYLHRVLPNTFIGSMLSFDYTHGVKFTNTDYLNGEKTHYTATGIGAIVEYDSRDFISNPHKGLYISIQETFFPKGLGNCGLSLWRTTFTADYYKRIWKGGILAADLYGEFNTDGTPWPLLARMGGSFRMRGYYEGQYADNGMITAQIELRQHIWRRIGCTVWGGAGNVFPSADQLDWSHTLPNYGVGFRWEFKKNVNVRLDYGFGKNTSGFLLNINEAF